MTTQLTNCQLWTMDDDSAEQLFKLTQRHLALAKEAIQPNTPLESKQTIQANIDAVRIQFKGDYP